MDGAAVALGEGNRMQPSFIRAAFLFSAFAASGCWDSTNYGTGYQSSELTSTSKKDAGAATTTTTTKKDPFEGAPAFASQLPDARATTMHVNGKVAVVPGKDTKCLGCHGKVGETSRSACTVNPSSGCLSCHMPAVKTAVPHSTFTDHHIRVRLNDDVPLLLRPPG